MNPIPDAQLTHLGLYVRDVDRMVRFYQDLLGLAVTDAGELRGNRITFLSRNPEEHHQLVLIGGRPADPGPSVVNQISFRVPDLEALQYFHRTALALDTGEVRGVNHGNAWSIYFHDPEQNRLEIYATSPWYVNQPYLEPLDLAQPAQAIHDQTLQMIKDDPTFRPVEAWKASMRARLQG